MTINDIYKRLLDYNSPDRLQLIRAEYNGTDEGFVYSVTEILKKVEREHLSKVYERINLLYLDGKDEQAKEYEILNLPNSFIDNLRIELENFIPKIKELEPKYKTENKFKCGMLFATGKMNDYFKINSSNQIIKTTDLSAPKLAKLFDDEVHEKYILAALSDNNKSVFRDYKMMKNIVEHCNNNSIVIDANFMKLYSAIDY